MLASIDARMGEVYAARYVRSGDGLLLQGSEAVLAPEAVQLADDGTLWHGVGSGFAAADAHLAVRLQSRLHSVDAQALPRASDVLAIAVPAFARGEAIAPELVQPAYLRDNVALTLIEQQAARAAKGA